MNLALCYLCLLPYQPPAPLGPLQAVTPPKDAPAFYDVDIEFRAAGERAVTAGGLPVQLTLQVVDQSVLLVAVSDPVRPSISSRRMSA